MISGGTQKRLAPAHRLPAPKRQRLIRRRLAPRASQACQACALSKLRCDNHPSCNRCVKKSIPCTRDAQLSDHDDDEPQEQVSLESAAVGRSTPTAQLLLGTAVEVSRAANQPERLRKDANVLFPGLGSTSYARSTHSLPFPLRTATSTTPFHGDVNPCGLLPAQDTTQDFTDPDILPPTWNFDAAFNVDNEFDWGGWALDANEIDFLSSLAFSGSDEPSFPPQDVHTATDSPVASSGGDQRTYNVQQAFRQSIGQWTPDPGHYRAHGEQIMVSEDLIGLKMDVLAQWDPFISSEKLLTRTRDKLVAMAVASCEPGNISAIISAFPALDVLERLINISLSQQKASVIGYIHIPTFSRLESRVETLAAMVVNGTSSSSSRAVQKFGYGLGEILSCNLHSLVYTCFFILCL